MLMQIKEYYNLKAPTDLEFSKPTIPYRIRAEHSSSFRYVFE